MKKRLFYTLSLIVILVLLFICIERPNNNIENSAIYRGNQLIYAIEAYYTMYNYIPNSSDWKQLRSIGFKDNELLKSYPEYYKINDTSYQLIYVLSTPPPYLLWDSREEVWKNGVPIYMMP